MPEKEVENKVPRKRKVKVTKEGKSTMKERNVLKRTGTVVLPEVITQLKQPTLLTLMRSPFQLTHYRILLSIIEALQVPIEESIQMKVPSSEFPLQLSLFKEFKESEHVYLKLPIKNFGFTPDRYEELKLALTKMATLPIELDIINPLNGEPSYLIKGMFQVIIPKNKYAKEVTIKIEKEVAKQLIDVSSGFTKFVKEIAISANNKYTLRMYLLISSWKDKGGFKISMKKFRHLLVLENKYKNYKDLYKRVIRPAYEDLHEKSDCWFEMKEVYVGDSKEPSELRFKVITAAASATEQKLLLAQIKNIEAMLFRHFQMEDKHFSQIKPLINPDNISSVHEKLADLLEHTRKYRIKNIPEYVLVALKNMLNSTPNSEFDGIDFESNEEK